MDPLFQKTIDGVAAQAQNKDAYARIVKAGLIAMFDKQTHEMLMEGLDEAPDAAEWAGKGVAGLLGMLAKQSRGTMPFKEMLLAGVTLLMHGLDFLTQMGKLEVSPDIVTTGMKAYSMAILGAAGIDEQKLGQMAELSQQAMADPERAEQIKQRFAGAQP
jgi:hypothetical protein